jgi:hypothetical protein
MSIFQLALLFMSFAQEGEGPVIAARAPTVAWAALVATRELGPVFENDEDGFKTGSLLMRMAYLETRGDHTQISSDGLSCVGILQVCALSSARRAKVRASAIEGMKAGLEWLHVLKKTCGGPSLRWLGAYASGKCGGASFVARQRCEVLGLCEER